MASVQFKNVDKIYPGNAHIVKKFNLDIEDGEFIVFLGPSGCGKSTTLRMLSGLEEISGGEIVIGDNVVNGLNPKERNIAMVFQSYALYPHMTVYDNIGFSLKMAGVDKKEIEKQVRSVADLLQLTPLLSRKPKALSGGQRQRVAMGRAMVRSPDVFLFDEPLSNLDAKLRNAMRSEIKKMQQTHKQTTVYVTHDQVEAMTLADRIVILRDGIIEQVGTPEAIYHHPVNKFVAGFIGSPTMNMIPAVLDKVNQGYELDVYGQLVLLGKAVEDELTKQSVTMGVRPSDLYLEGEQPTHSIPVYVTVDRCEYMGASLLVHGIIGESQITIESSVSDQPEAGSQITVYIDADHLHLFEDQTDIAIC